MLIIICLWDGANASITENLSNLFWDDSKLEMYIDNALIPMATALKNHKALFAWEIINEPEGIVFSNRENSEPCYDTIKLHETGAGWTNKFIPMENILNFIGRQALAIKDTVFNIILSGNLSLVHFTYFEQDIIKL